MKGNPIVQTYLPLLNSYGGNFVNDDWSPGFAGPEGVGALERLFSFIPYMPSGVAEFDTDQETQVMLQGKCTALTEYTGLAHRVDDPSVLEGRGQDRHGRDAGAGEERARRSAPSSAASPSGAKNPDGAVAVPRVVHVERRCRRDFARGDGSAAVTGSALRDAGGGEEVPLAAGDRGRGRQLGAEAEDAGRAEDGGHPRHRAQPGAGGGDRGEVRLHAIAQKHLVRRRPTQITAYIKQQGGYF